MRSVLLTSLCSGKVFELLGVVTGLASVTLSSISELKSSVYDPLFHSIFYADLVSVLEAMVDIY